MQALAAINSGPHVQQEHGFSATAEFDFNGIVAVGACFKLIVCWKLQASTPVQHSGLAGVS